MKKFLFLSSFLLLSISQIALAQNAWINEFHYDNAGTDIGEFIEIVLENQGSYTLSDFQISLYNGLNGTVYNSNSLDQFTDNGSDPTYTNFNYFTWSLPTNGIQNDKEGICLDFQGTVILYISYEGTLTATAGPANGLTSTDILVSESGSTLVGSSVGLTGSGTQYSDFTWTNFSGTATLGGPNGSQALPVELSSFSASIINEGIKLNWRTETEVSNYGFEIQRQAHTSTSLSVTDWEFIGFEEGYGNSNSPKEYSFIDNNITGGTYSYRLKQIDTDGKFEYSKVIEIDVGTPLNYELTQNYPNPFNPSTTIKFSIPEKGNVKLMVYNILGETVATLLNEVKEVGVHTISYNAAELKSGIYFYKLESGNFVQVKKMNLVR